MLILGDWFVSTAKELPKAGWGVRVVGDTVAVIGRHADLRRDFPDDLVYDAGGCVIAPGFINAHTHLYGVLAHGIEVPGDKAPTDFWSFLKDFWWPLVEDALDQEMICAATDWGCVEMLRGGVTSFYDCLEAPNAIPGVLKAQKAVVDQRGMRAILSFEATERVSPENGQLGQRENADFVRHYRQEGGLVSGMICFHTTFTCSAGFIRRAFGLAAELDCLVHMHCAEGVHEPERCLEQYGRRTIPYYDDLGVAGPRMLASQCVQIEPDEISLMAARGVRTVHMPLSNCEVGGGIAPIPQMLAAGIPLGLGSDGYINDFFEVMRGAFLIHKANHLDPQVMPADQVWYLATEGGARTLGLERVGRLAPGWQADLQLIDADLPTPLTTHNLYEQLLLYRNRQDVRGTMVAGKMLVRDGVVCDVELEELRGRVNRAAHNLWVKGQ